MNFDLTVEQRLLQESAHKLLSKHCSSDYVRKMATDEIGHSRDLWKSIAELGWTGLLIPEKYGGTGPAFLDLSLVLFEMGYFGYPGPFFPTAVMSSLAIMEAGTEEQKRKFLPPIAKGECIMTCAWLENSADYSADAIQMYAEKLEDRNLLSGEKIFVEQAHIADYFICPARSSDHPEEKSLFVLPRSSKGLTILPLDTQADDRMFSLSLNQVEVSNSMKLNNTEQGASILQNILLKSAIAKSAEMSGGAKKVLEMVVNYAKGRKQFGKPVGAFQAIQHHCSNMFSYSETLKMIANQAAWKIDENLPYAMDASICKAWSSDAYRKLVALGHQVMGGMGFMEEMDLQLYFRRAKAAQFCLGTADYHREQIACEMGL